jgi:putative nucleotidyltransferase with HDIG domain
MNKIFPEIKKIKDKKLRRKTADCLARAIKLGGWNEAELDIIPFTLLVKGKVPSLVTHTRAVTQTSIAMAGVISTIYGDEVKVDLDILVSGALLHDVGKFLEYAKEGDKVTKSKAGKMLRHPVSGTALAYTMGLPEEVLHIIAAHSHEGDHVKRSVEAIIVKHADFANFEALGG